MVHNQFEIRCDYFLEYELESNVIGANLFILAREVRDMWLYFIRIIA